MDVELPEPRSDRFVQAVTVLVGLTALAATALALLELDARRTASRATELQARASTALGQIAVTRPLELRFQLTVFGTAARLQDTAARLAKGDAEERAVAAAERDAERRFLDVERPLTGLPPGAAGRQALAEEMKRQSAELDDFKVRAKALAAQAARSTRRGTRSTLGLMLAAIAGALFGLAGVLGRGRSGWVTLGTGGTALVAAAVAAVLALLA